MMESLSALSVPCRRFCYVCSHAAAVIGFGYLLHSAVNQLSIFTSGFHAYFLAPRGICRTNLKKYGSWGVVTGASEGIGRGYALELARQGLNVVLISRSKQKLKVVADEIKQKYNKEVVIIVADFSQGQEVFQPIAEVLGKLDISILVNNVGLSYIFPDYFLNVTAERHRQIVEINCQTVVQMTYMVLPSMLKKNKGIIVNISSVSAISPSKLLVTYGATKRFIVFFTDGLRREYGRKGIIFQSVVTGMVTTAMSNARKVTFFTPDPLSYSRAAVATIGIQDYTSGYWPHALQQYFLLSLRCMKAYLMDLYMQRSRKILLRRREEGTLAIQLKTEQVL